MTGPRGAEAAGAAARVVRGLVAGGVARQATGTGGPAEGGGDTRMETEIESAAEGGEAFELLAVSSLRVEDLPVKGGILPVLDGGEMGVRL